jgi:hypothetical protein
MVSKTLYFYKEQVEFFKNLPGKFSEHVRKAVDEYIDRKRKLNVSFSQSKVGESNG